jgi:hypothetical protein
VEAKNDFRPPQSDFCLFVGVFLQEAGVDLLPSSNPMALLRATSRSSMPLPKHMSSRMAHVGIPDNFGQRDFQRQTVQ